MKSAVFAFFCTSIRSEKFPPLRGFTFPSGSVHALAVLACSGLIQIRSKLWQLWRKRDWQVFLQCLLSSRKQFIRADTGTTQSRQSLVKPLSWGSQLNQKHVHVVASALGSRIKKNWVLGSTNSAFPKIAVTKICTFSTWPGPCFIASVISITRPGLDLKAGSVNAFLTS